MEKSDRFYSRSAPKQNINEVSNAGPVYVWVGGLGMQISLANVHWLIWLALQSDTTLNMTV